MQISTAGGQVQAGGETAMNFLFAPDNKLMARSKRQRHQFEVVPSTPVQISATDGVIGTLRPPTVTVPDQLSLEQATTVLSLLFSLGCGLKK